jgi:hypothetical protein
MKPKEKAMLLLDLAMTIIGLYMAIWFGSRLIQSVQKFLAF